MCHPYRPKRFAFLMVGVSAAAVAGCQPENVYQPPPPPKVTVVRPVEQMVDHYLEETGTTEAVERVEVRARVRGYLEKVNFEPGSEVKQGDLLYVIEPRLYKAKVDASNAELDSQKVVLDRSEVEYKRQQQLIKENATSETNLVAAKAERDAALAAVEVAEAALDQAELDLDYTQVLAPIDGRVGKTLVKQGNLVGDGEATHLTTVIQYDPIFANFNISERDLLEIIDTAPRDGKNRFKKEDIKLYLRRDTDKGFPFEGYLEYADLTIDQGTGTFMVRGIFDNADRRILPGNFVRIRLPRGKPMKSLLVPERAVAADQAGKYVLVVDGEGTVERRDVTVGMKVDDRLVVSEGLLADAWVIVDGLQRARPGAKVEPERLSPSGQEETPGTSDAASEPPSDATSPKAEVETAPKD